MPFKLSSFHYTKTCQIVLRSAWPSWDLIHTHRVTSPVLPVSDSKRTWERPCHLLQSWLNIYHPRYAQHWICIWYPKRCYCSHSPPTGTHFFSANLSIIHPEGTCCIRSILHEVWLSIQSPGGSNSPAHTCCVCPLPLCCAPWSPGWNGFWVLHERQEQYSTTDLTPRVWIKSTKSNINLMHYKWLGHLSGTENCFFPPALG